VCVCVCGCVCVCVCVLFGTARVSWYQKDKTSLDFTEWYGIVW